MAADKGTEEPTPEGSASYRTEIILASSNLSSLDEVGANIKEYAIMRNINYKGPIDMPTDTKDVVSKHKRLYFLEPPAIIVDLLTSINTVPDVDVNINIIKPSEDQAS